MYPCKGMHMAGLFFRYVLAIFFIITYITDIPSELKQANKQNMSLLLDKSCSSDTHVYRNKITCVMPIS